MSRLIYINVSPLLQGWMVAEYEHVRNGWARDIIMDGVTDGIALESCNAVTVRSQKHTKVYLSTFLFKGFQC